MDRRSFLQTSMLSAASMLTVPSILHAMPASKRKIGIQLYTLRDTIQKDPKGVLKKLADFGYQELETYGHNDGKLFGMTTADFAAYVRDLKMEVVSGHYAIEQTQKDWEKLIVDAQKLNQKYMVIAWLQEEYRTPDKMKEVAHKLNKAGELCKKYGMTMGYHNHDFEFAAPGGKALYDILLTETDPALVQMEMDLFWVINAGKNPITYFEQYPGRFTQWHVKDMDPKDRNRNTEVGNGTIDFATLFANAKKSGLKHFYVEQETYDRAPIDSAHICYDNLKKII